tara:strand:+ start:146 stop:280 length:135 start_codon:yes stop_codon:yes gene_type:complete
LFVVVVVVVVIVVVFFVITIYTFQKKHFNFPALIPGIDKKEKRE